MTTATKKKSWPTPTTEKNFYRRYYHSLAGAVIVSAQRSDGLDLLAIDLPNRPRGRTRYEVAVMMDEEGNGPGRLCGMLVPFHRIKGVRIIGVELGKAEGFMTAPPTRLTMQRDDIKGGKAWHVDVWCDEEGNGPGVIVGLPNPYYQECEK